ncbi:Uncharacterized protein GBIM_14667 [Gryllus bimaculatus]|nr:Uncharacterized protein GBIM_14667 [Gryllus bimaculatus]
MLIMETETPFKEGYLLFPPHGVLGHLKKSWHKRYCQLFKSSKHGIERLEVFDSEDDLWKTSTVRIITLENCIKITQDVHKHPNVFTIITKTSIHHFGTQTEKELTDWITAFQSIAFKDNISKHTIEEDNELYCSSADGVFTVKLVPSEASIRCNLEPVNYVLIIASSSIQLRSCNDHRLLCTWPFRYIRRYGYREGKFTFEAGRKCDTGEGTFHLEHSNQQDIFRCMSTKMKHMRKLLSGETAQSPVIVCGDNQFQAALSMEARSRSPLPPSPTSATSYGDLTSVSLSQSSKLSAADSSVISAPVPPKPKPVKPPRKSLILAQSGKSEDSLIDGCGFGKMKMVPSSENCVLPLSNASVLTCNSSIFPSSSYSVLEGNNSGFDGYDKVEVRREAWRTMGVVDVSHSEKPYLESDIEEDGLESILKHSGGHSHNDDSFLKNQGSKILLPQMSHKSDASENYDTLQHFGSTSRLNTNPGYRHIPSIFPVTSGSTEVLSQPPSTQSDYEDVVNSMQACRMADDSHYGYGMIRKKSNPNENDNESVGPNHKVYNELEYAIVQKQKKV